MQCISPRSGLQVSGPLTASEVTRFDSGKRITQYHFTLAANHHGVSHEQHGHPCAEDPGRGSGFDQEVSCSLEGA